MMLSGDAAIRALAQIAPGEWSEPTAVSPAQRDVTLPDVGHRITAFRLIHAGASGTNRAAAPNARCFFPSAEAQREPVMRQIQTLPSPREALNFLDKYQAKGNTDTTYRGMMLHLAWWIHVGTAIRTAAESR